MKLIGLICIPHSPKGLGDTADTGSVSDFCKDEKDSQIEGNFFLHAESFDDLEVKSLVNEISRKRWKEIVSLFVNLFFRLINRLKKKRILLVNCY